MFIPRHELDQKVSPEEIEQVLKRMKSWFDRLTAERKIVSYKDGQSVTDGPFAETKEALAGSSCSKLAVSTKPRRSPKSPSV